MRTQARSIERHNRPVIDEEYFERKARSLVVAEDEIEAWELGDEGLDTIGLGSDQFGAPDAY